MNTSVRMTSQSGFSFIYSGLPTIVGDRIYNEKNGWKIYLIYIHIEVTTRVQ